MTLALRDRRDARNEPRKQPPCLSRLSQNGLICKMKSSRLALRRN